MAQDGIYSRTFEYKKNAQCIVCGTDPITYKLDGKKNTFKNLYEKILHDQKLKLKNPSVQTDEGKTLFMASKLLRKDYEENFKVPLCDLFKSDTLLNVCFITLFGFGVVVVGSHVCYIFCCCCCFVNDSFSDN